VLLHVLDDIRASRRRDMPKPDKFRLKGEDMREDKEMSQYVALSLALELCKSLPGWMGESSRVEPQVELSKAAEARQNSESERAFIRGPNGATSRPNPRNPHRQP